MKPKKWDIWRANLGPVIGSEQGKSRPVVVVSGDGINALLNILNIIPITTRKEGRTIYPNEVLLKAGRFGLENDSIALCHQTRTTDRKRLSKRYGHIDDMQKRNQVLQAIAFQLGMNIS